MTNLYTLQGTAQKMEAAVLKLENKIKKRGLLEKIGRSLGRTVDVVTGGSLRGFLTSFLPSNIGNKVLNSLDLQNLLSKNLTKLEKLVGSGTDEEIIKFVDDLIKAQSQTITQ